MDCKIITILDNELFMTKLLIYALFLVFSLFAYCYPEFDSLALNNIRKALVVIVLLVVSFRLWAPKE